MTTERIDIVVREDGSRVVKRNIKDIGSAADDAGRSLKMMSGILAGLVTGGTIVGLIRMADTYTNIQNKLRLVTTGTENLARVTKELQGIANSTRSDFEATSELYARLANSSKELGVGQKQLLAFTKTLNQAIVLSGASAEEAAGGIRQLAQGMASGTLRGDELNSVMENFPKVADIIAQGLGVTRGELRAMGAQGKITAKDIIEAFQKAEKAVNDDFGQTVPTVSQSLTVLRNNFMAWVGEADQALGITAGLSKMLLALANNLDVLIPILGGVAVAIAAAFAPGVIAAFAAQLRGLWVLIAANPFLAVAAAIAGVIAAIALMRDSIKLGIDDTTTLGDLMRSVWEDVGGFIASVAGFAMDTWGMANDDMAASSKDSAEKQEAWWLKLLRTAATVFDSIGWLVRGTFAGIAAVASKVISNIADNLSALGRAMAAGMKGDFGEMTNQLLSGKSNFEGVGAAWGKAFSDAAQSQISGGLEAWLNDRIARAQEIGAARAAEGGGAPSATGTRPHPKPTSTPVDSSAAREAAEALKQLQSALRSVLDEANPMEAAQRRLTEVQNTLNDAVKAHLITEDAAADAYDRIADKMEAQLHPLAELNRQLDENARLAGLSNEQRQIEARLLDYTRQLKEAGKKVNEEELAQLRARITAEQQLNAIMSARDQLEASSQAGVAASVQTQIEAYSQLKDATSTDDFNFLNRLLGGTLDDTQAAFDASMEQFQTYYGIIDQLRQKDLISEQLASEAKKALHQQEMDMRVQQVQTGLTAITGLMKSQNKTAFRIGQAAAIANATITGVQMAMNAYESASKIPIIGWLLGPLAAAGAAAAAAAQISQIRAQQPPAYRTGGEYTVGGYGGTDSQTVAFRATPGERVSINTPSQANAMERIERMMRDQNDGGSRRSITQNLTIIQQGKPNNQTSRQEARQVFNAGRKLVKA